MDDETAEAFCMELKDILDRLSMVQMRLHEKDIKSSVQSSGDRRMFGAILSVQAAHHDISRYLNEKNDQKARRKELILKQNPSNKEYIDDEA